MLPPKFKITKMRRTPAFSRVPGANQQEHGLGMISLLAFTVEDNNIHSKENQ
jgi:hypothetical protein